MMGRLKAEKDNIEEGASYRGKFLYCLNSCLNWANRKRILNSFTGVFIAKNNRNRAVMPSAIVVPSIRPFKAKRQIKANRILKPACEHPFTIFANDSV